MRERLSLNVSVARSCFVKCLGCYNHFGSTPNLTSTENIISFLSAAKKKRFSRVTLCGGDPLSRPDIIDLLKEIKKLDFFIALDTVGTPILGKTETVFYGRSVVQRINEGDIAKYVDIVGIPLEGPSNEIIALFRTERTHQLDEQILILSKLSTAKANICINTVVHKGNIDHIGKIPSIIGNISGIKKWQLFQFMPIGPLGYKNRHVYEVNDENFFSLKDTITKKYKENFLKNINIEFKAKTARKGNYMFVDSEGLAWVPSITMNEEWDVQKDTTHKRIIIGDLNNLKDHEKILEQALNPQLIKIESL